MVKDNEKLDKARKMIDKDKRREKTKNIRVIVFSIVIIVVVVLAGLLFSKITNDKDTSKSNNNSISNSGDYTPKADDHGAFEVPSENKSSASKRVDFFFDPMCPGCGFVDRKLNSTLQEDVKSGKIDLHLTPVGFLDSSSTDQYSTRASNAFATVATEEPDKMLAFMGALYDNQPSEGINYRSVSDDDLAKLAKSVGVSDNVADSFKDHKYIEWIKKNTTTQTNRKDLFPDGFSTPAVFVGIKYDGNTAKADKKIDFTDNDVVKAYKNALDE